MRGSVLLIGVKRKVPVSNGAASGLANSMTRSFSRCGPNQFLNSSYGKRRKLTEPDIGCTYATEARCGFAGSGRPRVDLSTDPWCWRKRLMDAEGQVHTRFHMPLT